MSPCNLGCNTAFLWVSVSTLYVCISSFTLSFETFFNLTIIYLLFTSHLFNKHLLSTILRWNSAGHCVFKQIWLCPQGTYIPELQNEGYKWLVSKLLPIWHSIILLLLQVLHWYLASLLPLPQSVKSFFHRACGSMTANSCPEGLVSVFGNG